MLTITLKRKFLIERGKKLQHRNSNNEEDEITLAEDIISEYQDYVFPGNS